MSLHFDDSFSASDFDHGKRKGKKEAEKEYNQLKDKYEKLFYFVKDLARGHLTDLGFQEGIARGYFDENSILARKLIKEIGELT